MAYLGKSPTEVFRAFSVKDTFTGDGSTTVFTLSRAAFIGSPNDVQVFVDNVRQEPGSGKAYTIALDGSSNATQLTFTVAPPSASEIYVIISAEPTSVVVPADGSVTTTKIADGSITSAKIADGTVIAADVGDNVITGAKLKSDITISTTGTITATSFSGDGASLTALNVSTDSTPQLGGNLDLNSNDITGTGDINITGNLTASGNLTSLGIDDNATSTAITIDSSQNVGIGLTNPASKLDIFGNQPSIQLKDDGATNQCTVLATAGDNTASLTLSRSGGNASTAILQAQGNFAFLQFGTTLFVKQVTSNLTFDTASTERMRIDSSGNVGIGTSSPDNLLHIEGDQPTYQLTSTNALDDSVGTETIADIDFEGQKNNLYRTTARIRARQDGTWSSATANFAPTALDFFTQDNSTSDAMTSPRMTINEDGNVGIGTSSPDYKLQVDGDIVPEADNTYDLGKSSLVWANIYTGDLHLSNEAKDTGNSVDGTKGNWTIQEGENDLYIINNKNGKKYKFNLEEIH